MPTGALPPPAGRRFFAFFVKLICEITRAWRRKQEKTRASISVNEKTDKTPLTPHDPAAIIIIVALYLRLFYRGRETKANKYSGGKRYVHYHGKARHGT